MKASLKEAVRKKTFVVMGIITLLFLVFWSIMLYFFSKEMASVSKQVDYTASRIVTIMGLQFSSMLMSLLTIMLASGAVSSDSENGLIHAIISRPLYRFEYIGGKFFGLLIISCVYAAVLFSLLLGLGGMFSLKTVTAMTAGMFFSGLAVYMLIPAAILCVTLFGSVSMRTVPNGILMIFIYILGNIGGTVEYIGTMLNSVTVKSAGIILSLISPFQTLYSTSEQALLPSSGMLDELSRMDSGMLGGGARYSVWMYMYIGVYMVGFLLLAVRKFSKKDIV